MRVTVVTLESSGQLLKVCADHGTFVDWLDRSNWKRYEVNAWEANVLGAEE